MTRRIQHAQCSLSIGIGTLPRLAITPSRFTTSVGGDVTFRCQVSSSQGQVGDASSIVQWQRADGRPLSLRATVRGNSLVLRRVESTDEGRYLCSITNRYGKSNAEAELTVSGILCFMETAECRLFDKLTEQLR